MPSLLNAIDEAEAVDLLKEIVRIPSITGSERELGDYLAHTLESKGLEVQVIETTKSSPNVLAWVRGSGDGPSLMLNGHIETVPVCHGWTLEPFNPVIKEGRIYGHGLRDMKAGLAAQIAAGLAVKRSGVRLRGDLCVANVALHTTSQETLENRIQKGTDTLMDRGVRTDLAVLSEPTDLDVVVAQRGVVTLKVETKGKTSHTTSLGKDRGISAIVKMAKFILEMEKYEFTPIKEQEGVQELLPGPTCFVNMSPIKGGIERNMIPDSCETLVDIRPLPGKMSGDVVKEVEGVLKRLSEQDPEFRAMLTEMKTGTPQDPYMIPRSHPLVKAVSASCEQVTSKPAKIAGINGWTDAAILMNKAKIPSVVCGPCGQPYYAPDDNCMIQQEFIAAAKVYALLVDVVCGKTYQEFEQKFGSLGRGE